MHPPPLHPQPDIQMLLLSQMLPLPLPLPLLLPLPPYFLMTCTLGTWIHWQGLTLVLFSAQPEPDL